MKKRYLIFLAIFLLLIAISGVSANNNTIGVTVNYEYATDNYNPNICIDSDSNPIQFIKQKGSSLNEYKLIVNSSQISPNSKYNISVSAPGYNTEVQKISSDKNGSFSLANLDFIMGANENYKLGKDITMAATKKLDFKNADDVLVITTAGIPKLNGKTSEDCIEGILSETNGKVTYGKGNMLLLRQTVTDPVVFCFVTKNGNSLTAAVFKDNPLIPIYFGTISDKMTREQWNVFLENVSGENAFAFASLANGWANGVSKDVLQEAAFHGHICDGTLGGYSIVQALLTYYPSKQETAGGPGSPGDITSYKILGVPGDSDDDAVLFFLDATPGKSGYVGFDTTATGATKDMIGFIRWQNSVIAYNSISNAYEIIKPGKGTLIVMSFNSAKNKELFKKETGINPNDGSLEELQYQDWWIKNIYTDPIKLVTILYELDDLNETQYYYFIGSSTNITFPNKVKNATNAGEVIIEAADAHGLDLAYIKELAKSLPKAKRDNIEMKTGNLNYEQFKAIGKTASLMAKQYFKDELGIIIEKDNKDFAVLTSAGYVYIKGQTTEAAKDGITEVFGSSLTRKTLLPIHIGVWKPLWFTFVLRDNGKLMSVFIRYNPDGTYFVGDVDGKKVNDIGMDALNNATTVKKLSSTFIPDNWFNIQSISNAWNGDPEFDQLLTFLFHDHACPGVQPGFFITDYIQDNYPLNENESYNYIASSIYCKDDSLVYLLGISPGMETYFNQRLPSEETESTYVDGATEEGVLMIWDKNLNIGRAVIINFKWAKIDTSMYSTSEAKRAATIQAYIDMYAGRKNPNVKEDVITKATSERWINAEQFQMIKSGSGNSNALRYLENLPEISKEDLLKSLKKDNDNVNSNINNEILVDGGIQVKPISPSSGTNKYNSGTVGVGVSPTFNPITAGETASEDSSNNAPTKAYEVSKKTASKKMNANELIYAVVIVIIIAGIAGYGFMRSKNK